MRRHNHTLTLSLALACALLLTAVGCSSTMTAGEQVDSAELVTRVQTRLAADPEVNPFELDVDFVEPGVIRLRGYVEEESDREAALQIARSTNGVNRVINSIRIGDKTAGEHVDDAAITAKVEGKLLADLEVSAANIDVDTRMGVVTLSGTVKTAEARAEAEEIARNTGGVKGVENLLDVQ